MLRIRNGAALKPQADRDEAQGDSSPAPSLGFSIDKRTLVIPGLKGRHKTSQPYHTLTTAP